MLESVVPEFFGYKVKPHEINVCMPLLDLDDRKIKLYTLNPLGKPLDSMNIKKVRDKLSKRITDTNPRPERHSGLGFGVISQGIVNISMWGRNLPPIEFPSVTYQTGYSFGKDLFLRRERDLERFGSYCFWESMVLAHEGGALRKFLTSAQEESDFTNYLNSYLEGTF